MTAVVGQQRFPHS
uniref:Uncharacterized protein n=1 Tax=Anguilla anguilla TaxID=7936 RepID=A0A0E9V6A9_ANGAN